MTDTTPTRQDRDTLAKVLRMHGVYGSTSLVADAILTSDWLAKHVRAKQAEALREYADACEANLSSRWWDSGTLLADLRDWANREP